MRGSELLCQAALVVLSVTSQSGALVTTTDVNASQRLGTQGEVSIAVDRFAPDRAIAAAMDVDDGRLLTMSTADAGASWARVQMPLPVGAALYADPMVAFDSRGAAYLATIPVGVGNVPQSIDVVRSLDGGRSWSSPVVVSRAIGRDDKVALAVDDSRESPRRDRVHVAWKWPSGGVFHAYSDDRGVTFTRPRLVDIATVSGLDLAVAADGEVFLAASAGDRDAMLVWRARDGSSFDPAVSVARIRADWFTSQPSHCRRQSLVHASLAVDRSASQRRGTLYLTWADYPEDVSARACVDPCASTTPCVTQVFVSRSSDRGASWTASQPLPGQRARADRFFPWIRVDPSSGAAYLSYRDSERDDRRFTTDVYLSRSVDGTTWEAPHRLSSEPSDARSSTFQYGDYQGLAVADGLIYAAWSDYRNPLDAEIYVGRAIDRDTRQ